MKKFLLFILTVVATLSANAQDLHVYKSKNLPAPDSVWVFKPKNYNENTNYPTIYLLHGHGGSYKHWNTIMNAQKYADDYGFIIICPDGLKNSWYLNSPVDPKRQFETFFFNELFTDMNKKYKVDQKNVFITGLSMGGHGALYLFLKRQDLFRSAGSTSGGVRLNDSFGRYGLDDLLGQPAKKDPIWDEFSVIHNIDKMKGSKKAIIFDCGAGDFFYEANNALKEKCDMLRLNATYISQPGVHDRAYWRGSIKQQFEFFKNQIQ